MRPIAVLTSANVTSQGQPTSTSSSTTRRRVPPSARRAPRVVKPPELTLERAKSAAQRILGEEGRLIAGFMSHYSEKRPTNIPVFNGSVVTLIGKRFEKVWSGDLDLSLWEERLVALARLLDHEICLFYDGDAVYRRLADPRSSAIVIANARGETEIGPSEIAHIFRAQDGTLRRHIPPEPKRWDWHVLFRRPRLLHFWRVSIVRHGAQYGSKMWIARIGRSDHYKTPLLVVAYTRGRPTRIRARNIEWTWYPANEKSVHAPRALINLSPLVNVRSFSFFARLLIWPGFNYQLFAGYRRRP